MLCRADMADELAKDEMEVKAQQDETELNAKKSALLDVIKKYVCITFFSICDCCTRASLSSFKLLFFSVRDILNICCKTKCSNSKIT